MKNKFFNLLKFLIGWPFSLLALFFIGKLIAPQAPTLLGHLQNISIPLLIASMLCFFVYFFIRGYIWKKLMKEADHEISYKDANFIWASSEMKRYIPGNIWSFLGRGVLFAERGLSKKDFIRTSLIEIELLTIGAALASFLALPFLSQYSLLPNELITFAPIIIIAGSLFFIFHRYFKLKHFILPKSHPIELLILIMLNTLLFTFFGLAYYFSFVSFTAIDPNLIWQLTGISVLAYLIGYLSLLTPSGFGVREGALIFALSYIMPISVAGFIALLARFTFIITEILYVGISTLLYKTTNKAIIKMETWIGEHKQIVLLIGCMTIYTIYFSITSNLRFENFYTGKFDLGNMVQTVWNTTQGRIFTFTNPDSVENLSRLSTHADFFLILLAPLYAIWPDPRNLLFIQTIIVAIGAYFVYLITKEVLKNKNLALVFGLMYLLNPSIQRANLYDFHAVVLATTFLLGAFYFFIKKRFWYFLLFAFLAGSTKEQVWLIFAFFGLMLIFRDKKYLAGITLIVASVGLTYYLISVAIPQAFGASHFALSYFSEFGDTPLSIVKNILISPQETLSILFEPSRINYLKQLFYPIGYLSLFAPWFLIFIGPELIINLLSNNNQFHQIYFQYTSTISPFLFIAAIYGVTFVKQILSKIKNEAIASKINEWINPLLIIYLIGMTLYGAYLYGPLPGAKEPNLDMITKQVPEKNFITHTIAQIPQTSRIASSNNLGAQLANREFLYILPLGVYQAEYVAFYLTTSQPADSLRKDQELVAKLRKDLHYQIIAEEGIFILFKKISKI